ncbi:MULTISPECIES: DUF2207 domain-containing protein [unclassified Cryobacterium]|uniref:DUF2207 domain-containing protein n=3 Tax=Cryobacterium TaxID=69578 RepID=UPI002AB38F79|nr:MULTISPECIES: DUF2207 domain-containing protein [unclassified Cryobacterium]MDY7527088.1 DUF2207 domain-containing protein [Cryobacterium sp. 10C2]MDY7557123.1 DUF2207 domain-containing protein [Cryobacterium sp. 10C3]MEB0286216.1 DUF2207 domain-containing protein [Cryobacterium sp. 10S3]WPX14553.1 DUF2207 domain-containing protein [Cryobacterium sp. 10S3]
MRRLARSLFVTILGAFALLTLSVPAAAVAAAPLGQPAGSVPGGVDDFSFDSMHSDFVLSRSADGHSALTTTETIVARFPDFDQNHGIRRSIPSHYDGHPTGIDLVSVTDENGAPRPSDTSESDAGDFFIVTSAADGYVHGAQTYVITYTQRDVTLVPTDAQDEEFYWEVNGTGWAQPFGSVSATLTVDPELTGRLTGQARCLQGSTNSSADCSEISTDSSAAATTGTRISASSGSLAAHEGLTLVVGFTPGTFVPRDNSFFASPIPAVGLAGAVLALVCAALAIALRATRWRNAPGRPTIIAEYLPPKGVNLLQAGEVTRTSTKAITAQFLQFAVRGNVRVLEGSGSKHYLLELRDTRGVDATELSMLGHLFPGLKPGTQRDLKKKSTSLTTALQGELRATRRAAIPAGFREKKGGSLRSALLGLSVVGGLVAVLGGVVGLALEIGGAWPFLVLLAGLIGAITTVSLASSIRPLTAAGAELRDYLEGVRLYIGVAETDRLRVLQSPQGALRSPYRPEPGSPEMMVDPGQPLQVLKLYERLLPFAVLFGQEKDWSAVLGEYYAQSRSQPDWYYGTGAFNAGFFAASLSGFASSTTSAWSGTASSSSSSGFGGGGSVGGGGGGGGGGGV